MILLELVFAGIPLGVVRSTGFPLSELWEHTVGAPFVAEFFDCGLVVIADWWLVMGGCMVGGG